jgi:DNA-directed RNA polymerase beta subunit
LIKPTEIREQFIKAFGPNAWGVKRSYRKDNITESLKRDTPLAVYSQIGRITTPSSRQSKNSAVRMPHPSQLCYVCLYETPEGEGLGLVKNLASSCYISLERESEPIINIIKNDKNLDNIIFKDRLSSELLPLTVNGLIEGWCIPDITVKALKFYKYKGYIEKDVCIFHNIKDNCVEVWCDSGRPTRPLFVVDDDNLLKIDKLDLWDADLDTLVRNNCIEYIDAREQEWLYIAETIEKVNLRKKIIDEISQYKPNSEKYNELMIALEETLQYSHCEIDPSSMLSIAGNLIPQANRQAGPRTSYQCVEENTLVLTENFTKIPIKDLKNGDSVISINPENGNIEKTQIYNHFVIDSSLKECTIYKIETFSGRNITTTDDHKFLTDKGWIEAGKLFAKSYTLAVYENGNIIYESIKSMKRMKNCKVADFTTVSNNHSFVANDFVTHNCSMGRQALTQYHSNEHLRFDASYKMVYYPTKTLFQNDLQETSGLNAMPNGQTVQVAILAHPDNAEDGIIFKEEAIKYGNKLDNAKKFTFIELIKSNNDYTERFAKPPLMPGEPPEKYAAIDDKGIPILDAYIREGDCVIGKVKEFNKSIGSYNAGDVRNVSQLAGKGESGYIDRVLITFTQEHQQQMIKVKVRQNRKYIPGDKLACLTKDHLVKTSNRGWVYINELNISDKIYTLNEKGEIECHQPTVIHHYSSQDEELFEIKNDEVDMCITKNHRLYCSIDNLEWNFKEAKDMQNVSEFYIKGEDSNLKIKQEDFKIVTGEKSVHCITIQNEIFLVKRHNKIHWTGNSRYSQKGTISRIIPSRDMPRVASGPLKGMVPDILINPHSQPSRMTMNMIIEILSTKASCINGKFYNATTFRNYEKDMEEIQQTLEDYGLDPNGYDFFEFPDGTPMKTKVYFGPCYYQALRHHVNDKIQMRARAGLKPSTRQPVSGRSNEGGLKVGEMERDALISHGSSALLRERLMGVSDQYDLPICSNCGTIAITRTDDSITPNECRLCKDKAKFGIITIPYVLKLLLFYLNAASINFRFKTTEIKYPNNRPIEEQFLV